MARCVKEMPLKKFSSILIEKNIVKIIEHIEKWFQEAKNVKIELST